MSDNLLAQPLTTYSSEQLHPLGTTVKAVAQVGGKRYENTYRYVQSGTAVAITAGVMTQYDGTAPFSVIAGVSATNGNNMVQAGMAMVTTPATAGIFFWVLEEGVNTLATYAAAFAYLACTAATGVLAAATIGTQTALNVGLVFANGVAVIWPKGAAGFYPDQT